MHKRNSTKPYNFIENSSETQSNIVPMRGKGKTCKVPAKLLNKLSIDKKLGQLFMCSECGKQFKSRGELTHHINSKCGTIKLFMCKVCGQELMTAGSLHNHMLRHKGEKNFMCKFCAKLFLTGGQLKVHERKHTNEKVFICEVCNKGFCHRQSLITHSSIHTGVKPYQCENCGKSFSCVGNLMKHRKTHADTCGLVLLNTHSVKNPNTKIKVRINTPQSCRLKKNDVGNLLETKGRGVCNEIPNDASTSDDVYQDDDGTRRSELDNEDNYQYSNTSVNKSEDYKELSNFNVFNTDSCYLLHDNQTTSDKSIDIKKLADQPLGSYVNRLAILEKYVHDNQKHETTTDCNEVKLHGNADAGNGSQIINYNSANLDDGNNEENDQSKVKYTDSSTDPMQENDGKRQRTRTIKRKCKSGVSSNASKRRKSVSLSPSADDLEKANVVTESASQCSKLYNGQSIISKDMVEQLLRQQQVQSARANDCAVETESTMYAHATTETTLHIPNIPSESTEDILEFIESVKKHFKSSHSGKDDTTLRKDDSPKCIKIFKNACYAETQPSTSRSHLLKDTGTISKADAKMKIKCVHCEKHFKTNRSYREHLVDEHIDLVDGVIYECKRCFKKFLDRSTFNKHERSHIKDAEVPSHEDETRKIKCKCCFKYFSTKNEMKVHQQLEHADILTCTSCEKPFSSPESLRTHLQSFHNGKPRKEYKYICEKCGKTFKQKCQMVVHRKNNCIDGPYFQCTVCKKVFSTANTLKMHMKTHDPEKTLLCKFCGKKFRWKGQLSIHERSHTGEKPFKCLFCPKAFAYRDSLITHSCLHTGIKPHFCTECGWRFSCIGNLNKHKFTHSTTCGRSDDSKNVYSRIKK